MAKGGERNPILIGVYRYALIPVIVLALMLGGLIAWHWLAQSDEVEAIAKQQAEVAFETNVLFRRWASSHGGVYVPVTKKTPPNPYLNNVKERDIVTPSGRRLTLMNPAYMLRQLYAAGVAGSGASAHITSLKPLRPRNAPDAWETKALKAFANGVKEVTAQVSINGQPYLRLMRPFFTEARCLKCHAEQGYMVGDVRGGVSVIMPLGKLKSVARSHAGTFTMVLSVLWGLGLATLFWFAVQLQRRIAADQAAGEALLEKEAYANKILRASLNGLYIYDFNLQTNIFLNPAYTEITGYALADIESLGPGEFNKLFHPDDLGAVVALMDRVAQSADGEVVELEYRFKHARGHWLWCFSRDAVFTRDAEGNATQMIGTFVDITAQKNTEMELANLNEELEQRVAQRTTDLEAINHELEAFAYSVSHDLRAPLRALDGFSLAVLEDYQDQLDQDGQDLLNRIRAASQRMGRLIDSILRLSRLTRAEMNIQPVDLSKMVADIAQSLKEQDPQRTVEFVIQPGVQALGDEHLLGVLLENLLGNAWKFSSKQSAARIEFGMEKPSADDKSSRAKVYYVKDNGAGFDPRYREKVFLAFRRLHKADEFSGSGIGLATVQRVINRHGGKVWADSREGQGATFYFTLGQHRV